jgi:LytS/YehU family sensor histidine kinase
MIWLARRFRVERANWPRLVPLHLAFALGVHLADSGIKTALPWLFNAFGPPWPPFSLVLARGVFINVTCYVVVAAITYAVDYAALYRERALAAAQLQAQLSAARLSALQSQLRPHFLFNTLNTIAEQVHTDPAGADRMITRLAALLRASIGGEEQEVSLRAELDVLRNYIEIMAVRFGARVTFDFDIAPEALDARVPSWLLQPLVENAIRHGVEPCERGGRVEVAARRRQELLELEVRDTGRGLPGGELREGVGLGNTRDRLRQLYGEAHHFAVRVRAGGGVIVAVTIPYRGA